MTSFVAIDRLLKCHMNRQTKYSEYPHPHIQNNATNMALTRLNHTIDSIEGWQKAFSSSLATSHPIIICWLIEELKKIRVNQ